MSCDKTKFVGRDVVLEYVISCGDVLPEEIEWKVFGSMRTKEFTLEWETTDATDDDSTGALRESLATYKALSISGTGTVKTTGAGAANLVELLKHTTDPTQTSGQPFVFLRLTYPDVTFIVFALLLQMSRSASSDETVTYSMSATSAPSDFGIIVQDTVPAPVVAPTAVAVAPSTLALGIGNDVGLMAVVGPAGAPQGVVWSSSADGVATVSAAGTVHGVGAGTATITAKSVADQTKSGTCSVTVS